MLQVEKLPAVGEVQQEVDQQPSTSFPLSFAAVVKSPKFVEKEAEQIREQERLKQEKLTKKVQEERRRAEEKADRDAAKLAQDARRKMEIEELRSANLSRAVEVSQKTAEYKQKMKTIAEQAKKDAQQSRGYEREVEGMSSLPQTTEPGGERGNKRGPPSPSHSSLLAKKPSTDIQNGGQDL